MMDRQRFGEAADMLDARYDFERKPEFMGRKEESLRELYHFCRDQERKPAEQEKKLSYFVYYSEVAFGGEVEHGSGCEEFATPGLAQEFIDQQTTIRGDSVTFKTILGESVIIVPAATTAVPDPQTAAQE